MRTLVAECKEDVFQMATKMIALLGVAVKERSAFMILFTSVVISIGRRSQLKL